MVVDDLRVLLSGNISQSVDDHGQQWILYTKNDLYSWLLTCFLDRLDRKRRFELIYLSEIDPVINN